MARASSVLIHLKYLKILLIDSINTFPLQKQLHSFKKNKALYNNNNNKV